jgi:hypothetical protein
VAIEQLPDAGWPAGENSPLLIMLFNPEELSEKFGLVFVDCEDDLGPLKLAVVRASFGIAGLIKYRDAPFEGTTVYVDEAADLDSTRDAVMSEFGLTSSRIDWITTELRRPR